MRERRTYWPKRGAESDLSPAGDEWPCGHPRTTANTQIIGKAGPRCRICRRKISRESARRHRGVMP